MRRDVDIERHQLPQWQFESTRAALKQKWNDKLGIAAIEGASDNERRIFYSGLYHALLYPKLFSENGVTFMEALAPVPLDHVPDKDLDLVLGADGGATHN